MEVLGYAKRNSVTILVCILIGFASFMLGGYLHNDGNSDAEIRAIANRVEQIDRDIKLEFGNLRSTITEGRTANQESGRIVGEVRNALEGDRETLRQMQDRIRQLQVIGGEVRNTKTEVGTGK